MTTFTRRKLLFVLAVACACGSARAAYPERPITLVVPFATGGPADAVARTVARVLSTRLGQPVVIENKAGAGGALGIASVARAPADGYMLGMAGVGAMIYAPWVTAKPLFDPIGGVTHISTLVSTPNVLVVSATSPYKTLAELLARAKREPGTLTIASAGVASSTHVVGALLQGEAGVRMTHVPYKGAAPALQDLMGGQVDMFVAEIGGVVSLIKSGRLRALALSADKRLAVLPDVPTAAEAGLPRWLAEGAYGLVAPPGLPPEIVRRLLEATTFALGAPEVVEAFAEQGGVPRPSTPEAYRNMVKTEQARWAPVIKAAAISAD